MKCTVDGDQYSGERKQVHSGAGERGSQGELKKRLYQEKQLA